MTRRAFDASLWHARDDSGERGDTRRLAHVVTDVVRAGDPAVIGFACDAGVVRNQGRPGATGGPSAIRRALSGLPAHMLTRLSDAGDVLCEGDALESAQDE